MCVPANTENESSDSVENGEYLGYVKDINSSRKTELHGGTYNHILKFKKSLHSTRMSILVSSIWIDIQQ
jgi:hypothetical protein